MTHPLAGKKQSLEHIKKRMESSRNNNFGWTEERRKKFSENNPMRNPHTRDLMIKSKKSSLLVPRGEKHHNWKGGVTSEHLKARGSKDYIDWRNAVYKRDGWKCQSCSVKCQKGNIVAHHIIEFCDSPELRYVVNNGMTMCRSCHARHHMTKNITHT